MYIWENTTSDANGMEEGIEMIISFIVWKSQFYRYDIYGVAIWNQENMFLHIRPLSHDPKQ